MRSLFVVAVLFPLASNAGPAAEAREVEIVALDYAFQLPGELAAGRAILRFANRGKVAHELNIVLLRPGARVQQLIDSANAQKPITGLVDRTVGVLFAAPGKRSSAGLALDLLPGRTYSVRCIFRDSAAAPRHEALGMFGELRVARAQSTTEMAVQVDTIVGTDYAFQLPATLSPGRHYLAFVNKGKQRHELSVGLLARDVALKDFAKVGQADGDVSRLLDGEFGLLHSLGGSAPAGTLAVDLLPGREYVFECAFQDTEKAPPHFMLGMFGSIRVALK